MNLNAKDGFPQELYNPVIAFLEAFGGVERREGVGRGIQSLYPSPSFDFQSAFLLSCSHLSSPALYAPPPTAFKSFRILLLPPHSCLCGVPFFPRMWG